MTRTRMILLLAALPQVAVWAQKPPQAGQGVTPSPARYCGHAVEPGTFVDARVRNASGEEAVVIRWLDPKGATVHSALSMGRCIAQDGDTIDGKVIVRVLPNSLAVSNRHALTAWEAEYREMYGPSATGQPLRGVFSENRFVRELDPARASEPGNTGGEPDFRWNAEQETLTLNPHALPPLPDYVYPVVTPPVVAQTPSTPASQPTAPATAPKANCTPQQGPKVTLNAPKKASAWACKTLGICPDNKPVVLSGDTGCPAAPTTGQPGK